MDFLKLKMNIFKFSSPGNDTPFLNTESVSSKNFASVKNFFPKMSKASFISKGLLALIAALILLVCGIILILMALLIPTSSPMGVLVFTSTRHLYVAGGLLLLIALAPLAVSFNAFNFQLNIVKRWQAETHYEVHRVLGLCNCSLGEDYSSSEMILYKRSEKLCARMDDEILVGWDGHDTGRFDLSDVGNLPLSPDSSKLFSQAPSAHFQNNGKVHYHQKELVIESVNCSVEDVLQPQGFHKHVHLEDMGHLALTGFPKREEN